MLPAFGLHTQILANRRRSALLIAGLFLLFYLLAFAMALLVSVFVEPGDTVELADLVDSALWNMLWVAPAVTALVAAWVWVGLRFNRFIVSLTTGSHDVSRKNAPKLYKMLESLCISRGMATPALHILETTAPNAYASGVRPEDYTITVTRGLIDLLDEREMRAVLAHELTHIRNDDVRTMMIAVFVVGIMSFVGELTFRILFDKPSLLVSASGSKGNDKGGGAKLLAILIALVCIALAWFLSLVIRFSLSRQREYLADAGAVELTHDPDAMISALRKIAGKGELEGQPSGIMELCLDNPRSGFADLFATHPSIEDRIDALVRYAGGRSDEVAPGTSPVAAAPESPAT